MINKNDLDLISQIVTSMDELSLKISEAYEKKDAEAFESIKRELLEFQKRLAQELQGG